jgi:hypothetical protein
MAGYNVAVICLKRFMVLVLLAGLLAFGCLGTQSGSSGSDSGVASAPSKALDISSTRSTPTSVTENQYVTKEGFISIKVNEGELQGKFNDTQDQMKAQGASLSDIRYSETNDRKQYTLTVKVAPGKFEPMMAMLQGIGNVKDMSVNLEDVTQQYVDLDTRIKNNEVELARLYELYNQSGRIEDLLSVEREISRVETDLEILKGQKQYLSSRIDKSTINVSIYEDKPATQQLVPLESIGALFFGAMAAAISLLVLGVGFLLPIAIVVGVIWFAYKAIKGKGGSRPRQPEHSRIPPPQ